MLWRSTLSESDTAAQQIPARGQCWATLTHLEMPGEPLQPRGDEAHSPKYGGTSLLWLLANPTVTPLTCCPAGLLLPMWNKVWTRSWQLLTWSCETAAICRSHESGSSCKCHSFGVQVMGWRVPLVVQTMLARKSQSSEDKGLVLLSRDIWELGQLPLPLCPPCSALRLGSIASWSQDGMGGTVLPLSYACV